MDSLYILDVDINTITYYLGDSEEKQSDIIRYLISEYKSSEFYTRSLCLNLDINSFYLSEDVYDFLGIEGVEYPSEFETEDKPIVLTGSTDMLIRFPHLVNNCFYEFHITSLGGLKLSSITSSKLEYSFDFNYLMDYNILFEPLLCFEFLKENISNFDMIYMAESVEDLANLIEKIYEENFHLDLDGLDIDLESLSEKELEEVLSDCDSKQVIDFKNYSFKFSLYNYVDGKLPSQTKVKVLSECNELFKDVTLYYGTDEINNMLCDMDSNQFSMFMSFLKENHILLKPFDEDKKKLKFLNLLFNHTDFS